YYARDAPLQLAANWDYEPIPANRDQIILRGAIAREPAERRTQRLFDHPLLPLLLAADAPQFRRSIIGQSAIRLNLALDRFGKRPQALRKPCRKLRQSPQLAHNPSP